MLGLGFLFEPYVIIIFPVMLKCVSNSNDLVRDGAKNTLAVIMNKLTAHGMRQVLAPVLNELISESQWKTRAEATRLLGYIVQCASCQVASSLPQIVESITEALSIRIQRSKMLPSKPWPMFRVVSAIRSWGASVAAW